MKTTNVKKLLDIGLISFAALSVILLAPVARADSDSSMTAPKIIQAREVTETSAVIDFKDSKFRNDEVVVRVSIKNEDTGVIWEKDITTTVSEEGKGMVTVGGLTGTDNYSFKVGLMKVGGDEFTKNSTSKDLLEEL